MLKSEVEYLLISLFGMYLGSIFYWWINQFLLVVRLFACFHVGFSRDYVFEEETRYLTIKPLVFYLLALSTVCQNIDHETI